MGVFKLKRIYSRPDEGDETRVLIDRLWPRGIKKADAALDLWLKDVAPSAELRKWFDHDPERWEGFRDRYRKELDLKPDLVKILSDAVKKRDVTLLHGAKDERFNNAVVLKEYLERFASTR